MKMEFDKLSKHLFWDLDKTKLDSQKNKKQIIQRVLDYGLLSDWKIIQNYYGIEEIAETATQIRDLGKKSMNFIATLSGKKEEDFRCCTSKPFKNKHWDF